MAEALLGGSGLCTGACVSPHLYRWSERTLLNGSEISTDAFAAAIDEVAAAIPAVEAALSSPGGPERVTQFEAAIAASFVAFRNAGVEVAVIEAGLGGRLDATNVIPSRATALTSVGLDHTQWLGSSTAEIAAEKLAVLQPGSVLVIGELEPDVDAQASAAADVAGATLVRATLPAPELLPAGFAPFLRRNAGVALALAAVLDPEPAPEQVREALGSVELRGRAELEGSDPPVIADVAHNEQGARALAEALGPLVAGRPVVACISLLADKDAEAIAAALGPSLSRVVCTAADPGPAMGRPGAVARDPGELARAFAAAGCETERVDDPEAAVARTLELARSASGVALCAGSHYLLRYLWTAKRAQSSSR